LLFVFYSHSYTDVAEASAGAGSSATTAAAETAATAPATATECTEAQSVDLGYTHVLLGSSNCCTRSSVLRTAHLSETEVR